MLLLLALAKAQSSSDGSGDSSGLFVEGGLCPGSYLSDCAAAGPCYDHAAGICGEDGAVSPSASDCDPLCDVCFPNSRCGQAELPFCLDHDGLRRCWTVHAPASLASLPRLVVDLHGYGSVAPLSEAYTGWRELADQEGFVVVWPQGTTDLPGQEDPESSWNGGTCCGAAADNAAAVDDVGFLRAVVANVAARFGIDAGRHVYWTGHSNGCTMAQRMAAEAGDVVAAVGCMAMYLGMEDADFEDAYRANGPVPVLEVHGTHDRQVSSEMLKKTLEPRDHVFTSCASLLS